MQSFHARPFFDTPRVAQHIGEPMVFTSADLPQSSRFAKGFPMVGPLKIGLAIKDVIFREISPRPFK